MTIAPFPAGRAGFTPDRIAAQATRRSRSLLAALTAWRDRRRAISHLRSLSDAQLRDIGIGRSEIETLARYGAAARRCGRG